MRFKPVIFKPDNKLEAFQLSKTPVRFKPVIFKPDNKLEAFQLSKTPVRFKPVKLKPVQKLEIFQPKTSVKLKLKTPFPSFKTTTSC